MTSGRWSVADVVRLSVCVTDCCMTIVFDSLKLRLTPRRRFRNTSE
jgi:hypothetical protein